MVGRLAERAKARELPMAQVALAWLLHKPAVTSPIFGATKPQHLTDAIITINIKQTIDEVASLQALYLPHPVAGFS